MGGDRTEEARRIPKVGNRKPTAQNAIHLDLRI